ncbi:MAG: hypothetical protein ACTS3F_13980 [Phycisphaerales bacterium]
MASIRVLSKVIGTMGSVSAGAVELYARSHASHTGAMAPAARGASPSSAGDSATPAGSTATTVDPDSSDDAGIDDLLGFMPDLNAPVRIVPALLRLLADTTRVNSATDSESVERLAAEYCVLLERYGTLKETIDALATGRRRSPHVAPEKAQSWQQVLSVSSAALEPALRRNRALLAHLTDWVAAQPPDLEHRLDRYRAWLDDEDAEFEAKAQQRRCCFAIAGASSGIADSGSGEPRSDVATAEPAQTEPSLPLIPPMLLDTPNERIEGVLAGVIDAKHPAEQLSARSIDLSHRQLAEALRSSEDPIERLVGALALNDFDFADAALQAQGDRLGPVNAPRLRGDRMYWEGRFAEAIPHYRAALEAHDDLVARCNLACALIRSERGSRENNAEEAIALLRQTIAQLPAGTPERARTLTILGAIKEMAPINEPEERRREALRCYEQALQTLERDRDGIWWAGAHLHAGLTLLALHSGDRSEHIQHALDHFQSAAEFWTRDSDPSHWSTVQNNLGRAWERLPTGDRRRNLENAKACFESALEVRTQEEHPAAWARLQNNLGNLHLMLPDRDGVSHIHRAIEHHTNAARVWSSLDRRREWAATHSNLGNAHALLPHEPNDHESRDRNLGRAIACYRSALEVRTKSASPYDWAATMNNLGSVLMSLPDPPGRSEHIEEAIRCFQHALEVRDRDRFALDWARTVANLALAMARRPTGDRGHNITEALDLIDEALEIATPSRHQELHKHVQHRRELILRERARSA